MISSSAARRITRSVWRACLVLGISGCGSCGGGGGADANDDTFAQLVSVNAILSGALPLPSRADALALAQTIESYASKEGSGARAVELHFTAGLLVERIFRVEGKDQDAKEAMTMYASAAKDVHTPLACDASLAGALLQGDAVGDAEKTYAEVYRTRRMFGAVSDAGPTPCAARADAILASLESFRPPARVLSAIDDALAAQGALGIAAKPDAATHPTVAAHVVRVEQWPSADAARVVITLDRPAPFRTGDEAGAGGKGARVFVDLDGVEIERERDGTMPGIVTHVHAGATSTGTRVMIDVSGTAYRRVFNLLEPYRIVVDIAGRPPGTTAKRHVQRVVLDPGHGGIDSGAIGPTGVKEKDVTLDIVLRASKALIKAGLDVSMTRTDDRFVTLEERTAFANGQSADLFVSVHCNAAENHVRRGIETYVLDTTKDDIAARVASRENATSQAATAELGNILASMRLADQATHSTHLADLMQKAALASLQPGYSDVLDGGVHYAGFYVLVGARMPSILFETSYISHTVEEQRLASEDYRQRLADAIANALRAYKEGR